MLIENVKICDRCQLRIWDSSPVDQICGFCYDDLKSDPRNRIEKMIDRLHEEKTP